MNEKSFLIQLHKSFGDRVGNFKECEKRISFHLKHSSVSVLHPNIVALGNASQTMHPVAGQGLNTGFKDAYKLNKAIKKFNDDKDLKSIKNGILGDIAPTILHLMGVEQPKEMTQESLL